MASNYDSIDLSWSWKGDLKIDSGDLAVNSTDALESIQNEIITIIKSSSGDWLVHPQLGTNLWQFVGEPNTRENAEKIKDAIATSLISAGIVSKQDIKVDVNAIGIHNLYVKIFLSALSTTFNKLTAPHNNYSSSQYNEGIEINFLFDTTTSAIYY